MWYVLFVWLGLIYPSVDGIVNSTSQVYEKLEKAIKSKDGRLCNELLEKHYFTENADNSIWKHAMKEHEELLERTFPIEDHIAMNKDIRNVNAMWQNCRKSSDKNYCDEILETLHRILKDFQWPADGFQYHRIDYVSIRVVFQSMVILMFSSILKAPWVNKFKDVVNLHENILDQYNEITKYLEEFREKVKEERPFEISEAEVCSVKKYLWKEFEQPACEKRWHKNEVLGGEIESTSEDENDNNDNDVDNDGDGNGDRDDHDGDKTNDKNDHDGDKNNDESVKDGDKNSEMGDQKDNEIESDDNSGDVDEDDVSGKEIDVSNENKRFFDVFANPDMDSVNLVGGKSGDYDLTLTSRYTDFGGKKEFVTGEKDINIKNTERSEVIEELINLTIDKRDEYVKEKLKEMDKYLKSTFAKVMQASEIFVKGLEKSLGYWKSKINNKKTV